MKHALALLAIAVLAVAQQQRFDGKSWWRHIEALAADKMEGRDTGSPGLQRAEAYVVDELKRRGLVPGGTDGYYQPIQLESREIVEADSSAVLVHDGEAEPLALGEDAIFSTFFDLAPKVEAPLVFLGYGMKVPELNYDDLAGFDLHGKVGVVIAGLPAEIDGAVAAHYGSVPVRWQQFRKAGLIGLIAIAGSTFSSEAAARHHPTMRLAGDTETAGNEMFMAFNPAKSDKLFAGTRYTAAQLIGLANDRKPLPRFILNRSIRATARVLRKPVESANVIAKLEGADPKLKNEYVVFSAHIDHLGIGEPVNGDRIYHGAIDNASGVAALLDIAAELKEKNTRPKRSVLFAFFTGEEKGLLGSKYFAGHPTVDVNSIVANLNIDGIHAITPLKELRVLGLEESDLGDAARRAAASEGIPVDSEGQLNPAAFTCCGDQYSFIVRGIPAVVPKVGFPGESAAVLRRFRRERQHTPLDNLQQPVELETAGKYEEILLRLLLDISNAPQRPQWKAGSFYRRYVTR